MGFRNTQVFEPALIAGYCSGAIQGAAGQQVNGNGGWQTYPGTTWTTPIPIVQRDLILTACMSVLINVANVIINYRVKWDSTVVGTVRCAINPAGQHTQIAPIQCVVPASLVTTTTTHTLSIEMNIGFGQIVYWDQNDALSYALR